MVVMGRMEIKLIVIVMVIVMVMMMLMGRVILRILRLTLKRNSHK